MLEYIALSASEQKLWEKMPKITFEDLCVHAVAPDPAMDLQAFQRNQ